MPTTTPHTDAPDRAGLPAQGAARAAGRPAQVAAEIIDTWVHAGERRTSPRPALATHTRDGWSELTYGDLDRSARRVAARLARLGVVAGDRIGIMGPPCPEWVVALFGVWRRGAVAVPLDLGLGRDDLAPVLERARLAAAVCGTPQKWAGPPQVAVVGFDEFAALPEEEDAGDTTRRATDPAAIVWTSGTSGAPKGVTLSFVNIAYVVDRGCRAHDLRGDDQWLSILPLNHMLELSCGLLPALATGATFAFAGTTVPRQVLAAVTERHITRMNVVPRVLNGLLPELEATGAGRERLALHCGGAPVEADVVRALARVGVPVYTGYGCTETAPTVAMNTPAARREGSVGRPLPGTRIRIVADGSEPASEPGVGEILVRSPGLMLGYWDDPGLTATAVDDAGWFHTGDLGHLDDDGFLHVTGRAKSLIVLSSGKKVQPEEVESALARSAVLCEACVVGRDDQVWAAVVATPDLRARFPESEALQRAAEDEVARFAAGLAAFKRPRVVRVVDGLPRTRKLSVRRSEVLRLLD